MKVNAKYVLQEPDYRDAALPDSLDFTLRVQGSRILGEVYLPSGIYDAPHPTVVLCHGIPGTNSNDDLAQCLRRMGCIVIRIYHRGAWGSDGYYTFSHCIEDCIATAEWARTEGVKTYGVDPEAIFLIGHSAGGSTVINAAQQLPYIRGVVPFCPLDHPVLHKHRTEEQLKQVFRDFSNVLHIKDFEELWQDSKMHQEAWSFHHSIPYFETHNLLLIGAAQDTVTPPDIILTPFWKALQEHGTKADHKFVVFPSNHSLDTARLALAQTIGEWIEEVVKGQAKSEE